MSSFEVFKARCKANQTLVEEVIRDVYTEELQGGPPCTVIDGGANVGYHTVRLARLPSCGEVIAIEADPFTVQALGKSVADLAPEARAKVRVVQKALQERQDVDSVTWMSSVSHPTRSGISSIWQNDEKVQFREAQEVPATTIDRLAATAAYPIRFIKLDLEGGDFMALQGAAETLRASRPLVVFENSVRAPGLYGYAVGDMMDYFAGLDYVPISFSGQPSTREAWFDFWEKWAAPREAADRLSERLRRLVTAA